MLLHKLTEARDARKLADEKDSDLLRRIRKIVESVPRTMSRSKSSHQMNSDDSLVQTIQNLVATHNTLSKCCGVMLRYERDLASILGQQSTVDSSIPASELLKRSYLTVMEADRQFRSQANRIEELEVLVKRKSLECKELRERMETLEGEYMTQNICVLQERSMVEVGSDGSRRSALNTLIEGYKKSEARRRALEIEVVRLRAISENNSNRSEAVTDQYFPGNLFIELQELREIVKEFVVRNMGNDCTEITESNPRLFPPQANPVDSSMDSHQWTRARGESTDALERLTENLFSDLGSSRC